VVRSRLYQGKLRIYGWIYLIETGEVLSFDPQTHAYQYPQSQLTNYHPEVGPAPGQFDATSAPNVKNVACELPSSPVSTPESLPGEPMIPSFVPAWLTPEQAARIYNG
jgi:carbonic anhydrase